MLMIIKNRTPRHMLRLVATSILTNAVHRPHVSIVHSAYRYFHTDTVRLTHSRPGRYASVDALLQRAP